MITISVDVDVTLFLRVCILVLDCVVVLFTCSSLSLSLSVFVLRIFSTSCRIPAYMAWRPSVSVRLLTLKLLLAIWHISRNCNICFLLDFSNIFTFFRSKLWKFGCRGGEEVAGRCRGAGGLCVCRSEWSVEERGRMKLELFHGSTLRWMNACSSICQPEGWRRALVIHWKGIGSIDHHTSHFYSK